MTSVEPDGAVLRAAGVVRAYGGPDGRESVVLGPVDLEVRPGEFVALVGPSGCGKSTLLHLLAGLDTATHGKVVFRGEPLKGPGPELAMVFQHYTTLPWLNVRDNVSLGLKWSGMDREGRATKAQELLDLVGLRDAARQYPAQLSGGMRQRVAIARALAGDPAVLLMDEPFGALDAQTRAHLQVELLRIAGEAARPTVFVTHDIDESVFLADRVVVLTPKPGRIYQEIRIDLPRDRPLNVKMSDQFGAYRARVASALERATLESLRDHPNLAK